MLYWCFILGFNVGSIGSVLAGIVVGFVVGWCLLVLLPVMYPGLSLPLPTSTVTSTVFSTRTVTSVSMYTVTSTLTRTVSTTVTVRETIVPETKTVTETLTSVVERTRTVTSTSVVTSTIVYTTTFTATRTETKTIIVGEGVLPPSTRCFDLYLLDEGYWVRVCTSIAGLNTSIAKPIPLYRSRVVETILSLVDEGASSPAIRDLAYKLWDLAGGDVELFLHYAAWSLYQLSYNETKARLLEGLVQHPVYTLYAGSGVCVDYTILYSSLLKAVGISHVIVLANVTGQGVVDMPHTLIGVELSSGVKLPFKYHGYFGEHGYKLNASIEYNGRTYYLVDPTPSPVVFIENACRLTPPQSIYPAFAGEIVWDKVVVRKVIEVSGG